VKLGSGKTIWQRRLSTYGCPCAGQPAVLVMLAVPVLGIAESSSSLCGWTRITPVDTNALKREIARATGAKTICNVCGEYSLRRARAARGQYAFAEVTLNRTQATLPHTVCAVVHECLGSQSQAHCCSFSGELGGLSPQDGPPGNGNDRSDRGLR